MSKRSENGSAAVLEQPSTAPASEVTINRVLTFHREHPGNRASYTIPGVPGNMVIFRTMFADGVYPATITVDCALAQPVAKVDKSAERAAKAAEKAAKAAERLAAQQAKAAERQAKANAALAAAQAKLAKAQAGTGDPEAQS